MNSSNKHLFTFANAGGFEGFQSTTNAFSPGLDFSAPVICPPGTNPKDFYNDMGAANISTIDVLNNFDWTLNAGHSRQAMDDIPYIRMSEYSINFNSFLQNLKFMLNVAADAAKSTGVFENDLVKNATGIATGAVEEGIGIIDKIFDKTDVAGAAKEAKDGVKDFLNNNARIDHAGIPHYLRPYNGLYGVRPTGFQYKIPYFNADWKTVRSSWGDITGGGILGSLANIGQNVAGGFVEAGAMMKTGAYFERPKSYAFDDAGEAITFKFPLYNTRSYEELTKNFELVLMLTYQQLANKMSHVLLDPPVIYDVEIPGKYYTPYGYIANLSIQGIGAQRLQTMNLLSKFQDTPSTDQASHPTNEEVYGGFRTHDRGAGHNEPKRDQAGRATPLFAGGAQDSTDLNVTAIIPDVWEVTITMQSLVPNTKNLFYHSLAGAESLFDTSIRRSKNINAFDPPANGEPLPPGESYKPSFTRPLDPQGGELYEDEFGPMDYT